MSVARDKVGDDRPPGYQYMLTEFYKNNNVEERRSGTTWTGFSQKDLRIRETTKEDKNAKKFVEKRARAFQACSWRATRI